MQDPPCGYLIYDEAAEEEFFILGSHWSLWLFWDDGHLEELKLTPV